MDGTPESKLFQVVGGPSNVSFMFHTGSVKTQFDYTLLEGWNVKIVQDIFQLIRLFSTKMLWLYSDAKSLQTLFLPRILFFSE